MRSAIFEFLISFEDIQLSRSFVIQNIILSKPHHIGQINLFHFWFLANAHSFIALWWNLKRIYESYFYTVWYKRSKYKTIIKGPHYNVQHISCLSESFCTQTLSHTSTSIIKKEISFKFETSFNRNFCKFGCGLYQKQKMHEMKIFLLHSIHKLRQLCRPYVTKWHFMNL